MDDDHTPPEDDLPLADGEGSDAPEAPGPDPVPLVGPVLGVMIGFVIFRLLPGDTSIWLGLLIALVAIAVTTFASIEISRRRRARRG
jgi:hypothetical protein